MNRQGLVQAAQSSVTPQHVQQGLFLMLALIVTLLLCQQYQRWADAHAVAPAFHSATTQQHFSPALAQANQQPVFQQVEEVPSEQGATQQPHWVF